ncbi:hypothetical protein RF11_12438 [Thelohanellus kitauei]|uniref:Uncharacterized protein n=1 Tax=Thelohanellus kitauei TaxID=669202 RepID=A0A0C2J1P0_THEKT|nr:hypothetical protein RF11_12438 [Thelohanellus kitauei]
MTLVIKTINCIKSRGLNHRQYRSSLEDTDHDDLQYYCAWGWLSRVKMLKRFCELIDIVAEFDRQEERSKKAGKAHFKASECVEYKLQNWNGAKTCFKTSADCYRQILSNLAFESYRKRVEVSLKDEIN